MEIYARGRATGSDTTGSGELSGIRYDHSGIVRVRGEAGIFCPWIVFQATGEMDIAKAENNIF